MTVLSMFLFNFIGWNRTSQKQENRSELITPKPLIIYGEGGHYWPYCLYWRRLCCQSCQILASILYGSFLFMTGDLLRKKIPANIIKYSPNYCLEWFLAKLRFLLKNVQFTLRVFRFAYYIAGSVEIFLHFSTEFYYFTELKTYHLSYSIYKYDAIDTADPSSIQDAWLVIWTS